MNGVDAIGAVTPTAKLRLLADPAVAFYRGAEISRVNLPLVWKGMP